MPPKPFFDPRSARTIARAVFSVLTDIKAKVAYLCARIFHNAAQARKADEGAQAYGDRQAPLFQS